MSLFQEFNNKSYNDLTQTDKERFTPFLRAWSWGINFDDNTQSLSEYQANNGHHLRLIAQSAILEDIPESLKIISSANKETTSIMSIETLANLDVPINVIHKHFFKNLDVQVYNNGESAIRVNETELSKLIREVCQNATRRTIQSNDNEIDTDKEGLIPVFMEDTYTQNDLQTIALYNFTQNLSENYSFRQDCQPNNYARHIHMSTLSRVLGLDLKINDISCYDHTPNDSRITVSALHRGLAYDPHPDAHKKLYTNPSITPIIHNGTCGYHTVLLLIRDAWAGLSEKEKRTLLSMKHYFIPNNRCALINKTVQETTKSEAPEINILFSSESLFYNIRPICYGTLAIIITASITIIGWSAFIAMLASPAGPAIIAGVLASILLIELASLPTDHSPSIA